jgi:peptide chain release factor 2
MLEDNFWQDVDKANNITQELSNLTKKIAETQALTMQINSLKDMVPLIDSDETLKQELTNELQSISNRINELELNTLLNGPYDSLNCFLEIHPGAGGTEACDWASMLLRMYTRFCEKNNYSYEIISKEDGEEAGIKEATILIKGFYAYGYFKSETGVHRLVRISPFDSNSRRHTSFASILITPEFNNNIDIDIKESDLKIDVYHSSGAGGQSVNTSNSAVRITHIPTKTVVTCQVERSQMMNKERAMEMLKSKLYQQELTKEQEKEAALKGNISSINFGSQIRSYVLEPYTMVKDLRSNYSTTEAFKVLDGDILTLMESVLKIK